MQERQLEEAVASAAAVGDLEAAEETMRREQALVAALSEAQSSLNNMKKLHDASQKQLFSMQSRGEEEQVGHMLSCPASPTLPAYPQIMWMMAFLCE